MAHSSIKTDYAAGIVPLDSVGQAKLTTSLLAIGSHSITVTYSGNDDFFGGTSMSATELVTRADTEVIMTPLGVFNNRKLVSVSLMTEIEPLAPGGGVPSGIVKFMVKKKTLGVAVLTGGEATLTVRANGVLNKAITIVYSGDPNFQPSTATPPKLRRNRSLDWLAHWLPYWNDAAQFTFNDFSVPPWVPPRGRIPGKTVSCSGPFVGFARRTVTS